MVTESNAPASSSSIHNLIVTAPPRETLKALATVAHRLGRHTTICLVHDGLGVVDSINAALFPDAETRPTYCLGHMSHAVQSMSDLYSIRQSYQGAFYVQDVFRDSSKDGQELSGRAAQESRQIKAFISLLSRAPELRAKSYNTERFFMKKLPTMAFLSIADPITLLLDCSYSELVTNSFARQFMHEALGEIGQILRLLPELRGSTEAETLVREGRLASQVWQKIHHKRSVPRSMMHKVRGGYDSNIDYQTGWFVDQARRLGVACPLNRSLLLMVKAMGASRVGLRESAADDASIPFHKD